MSAPRPAISHGAPAREAPGAPATLIDVLRRAAEVAPEERIVCLRPHGSETARTYAELALEAARVLGGLRRHAPAPGAPVILQLDRNEDFIAGFWGCVAGGLVPVPVSTPASYAEASAALTKLTDVWSMLDRPLVLAGDDGAPAIAALGADGRMPGVRVAALGDLAAAAPRHDWVAAAPDDLAVLLLTSGTTEAPRLVIRTHRRILAAAARLIETVGFSSADVVLGWMPLDHGTGFARHVRATYTACRQVYAPRESFMADPLRWLDWIERYRVTDTEAPNFGYGLVNARAEEIGRRRWDLRSIKFVLNIAETIVERTAARFLELLAPHGLSPAAMRPIYGMSETGTLTCATAVAAGGSAVGEPGAGLVEVGSPTPGVSIRIVDGGGRVVPEGALGRIQARDPMVTAVYYRRPDLDETLLTADGWVETGDLGVLRDGRLTVTGREKDVIVVNGLKYGCLAIESTVEDVAGVEPSCTAAVAHRDAASETDGLAIVFSPSASAGTALPWLLRTIRDRVVRRFGISPAWIAPLERSAIPRTASGKIQRAEIRARLAAGELDGAIRWAMAEVNAAREGGEPRSPLERWLLDGWREALGDPELGINDNFFAWGGNSAAAAAIIARIAGRLGVELRLRSLLEAPTVADLAALVLERAAADRNPVVLAE